MGVKFESVIIRGTDGGQDTWATMRSPVVDTRRCEHSLARICVGKVLDEERLCSILDNTPTPVWATNTWEPALMSSYWMAAAWARMKREKGVIAARGKQWYVFESMTRMWLSHLVHRTTVSKMSRAPVPQPINPTAEQRPRTIDGLPILSEPVDPLPILDVTKPWALEYADTASISEHAPKSWFKPIYTLSSGSHVNLASMNH